MKSNRYSVHNSATSVIGVTNKQLIKVGINEITRAIEVAYKNKNGGRMNMDIAGISLAAYLITYRLRGKGLHIFIESKELIDFLISSEIKDTFNMFNFIKKNHETEMDVDYTLPLFIHHKNRNTTSFEYLMTQKEESSKCTILSINDGHSAMTTNIHETRNRNKSLNLLFNVLYYIEAFPECLVDGTPDEKRQFFNFYKAKNRIKLKTHESLIDRSGVTPHLRRGHFRRLESDYYKKKKGQVIFIHSSMIKGHAKTLKEKK